MALVSMRQLLDHAAENGWPAGFQRQQPGAGAGHHGRRRCSRRPGDHAGLGRRPQICRRSLPAPPDRRRRRSLSAHPGRHAPGPRPVAGGLHGRDPLGLHLGDDGRLAGSRRQDGRLATSTTSTCRKEVVKFSHAIGVTVEAELGVLGSLETMKGDKEDGHGADGTMTREQLLTDVGPGRRLRRAHPVRRAGHRHRHLARRLQVHPQADRRHPGHRPHQGNPRAHPEHPPGDARFVVGAAGAAGRSSANSAAT